MIWWGSNLQELALVLKKLHNDQKFFVMDIIIDFLWFQIYLNERWLNVIPHCPLLATIAYATKIVLLWEKTFRIKAYFMLTCKQSKKLGFSSLVNLKYINTIPKTWIYH